MLDVRDGLGDRNVLARDVSDVGASSRACFCFEGESGALCGGLADDSQDIVGGNVNGVLVGARDNDLLNEGVEGELAGSIGQEGRGTSNQAVDSAVVASLFALLPDDGRDKLHESSCVSVGEIDLNTL